MSLTEREREVLTTIVESHIANAAPVSSRSVARQSRLDLSPASIRGVMADLTEAGWLEQPHTSAGRVPTKAAFRFYLDDVMRLRPLPDQQKERIASHLLDAGLDVGDMLKEASRILSGHSLQIGVASAPRHSHILWKRIEFALVKPGLVMAVLIMQGGLVFKRLIAVGGDVTPDDLVKYGNCLNHMFRDMTLSQARTKLAKEVQNAEERINRLYFRALALAAETFKAEAEPEIITDGASNALSQPEFADLEQIRDLLSVLEDRSRLLELLDKTMDEFKTVIIIGGEEGADDMGALGVISCPYGSGDHPLGALGVLGPLRMDYAKLVPVVNYTAGILSKMLNRRF